MATDPLAESELLREISALRRAREAVTSDGGPDGISMHTPATPMGQAEATLVHVLFLVRRAERQDRDERLDAAVAGVRR